MRLKHAELEGSHHFAPEASEMADVFGPEDSNSHVNIDTSQVTDREAAFPSLHPSKDLCSHADRGNMLLLCWTLSRTIIYNDFNL